MPALDAAHPRLRHRLRRLTLRHLPPVLRARLHRHAVRPAQPTVSTPPHPYPARAPPLSPSHRLHEEVIRHATCTETVNAIDGDAWAGKSTAGKPSSPRSASPELKPES